MVDLDLRTCIAQHLRVDSCLTLIHLSASIEEAQQEYDSHLFVAVQNTKIIYALELMLYTKLKPAIIYVSKVDTTGCHDTKPSPIAGLTQSLLQYMINQTNEAIRLCLFARSQPQYVFPCSSQNTHKHILHDSALVKWWLRTLEELRAGQAARQMRGYLTMPGSETSQCSRLLPDRSHWSIGHPYAANAVASKVIPNFPDDPKARLIADLKSDGQDESTTIAQFWDLMSFRQEICSGHAVGFIVLDVQAKSDKSFSHYSRAHQIDHKSYRRLQEALQRETYANDDETLCASERWTNEVRAQYPESYLDDIHGTLLLPSNHDVGKSQEEHAVNVLVPRKRKRATENPL